MKRLRVLAVLMLIAGLATQLNAQLDTTGLSGWDQMYNSMASWEEGAFSAHATTHPDYGWGNYNSLTHGLVGDSIFVIKLQDGSYKKLWIVEKNGSSVYTFRYSDLNGADENEVDLDMTKYPDKQFIYYNLRADSLVDEQPAASDWDLLLTKYTDTQINYPVTGFLSNDGVTVSVFNAADSTTAADATLADTTEFTDSISAIGNSWSALVGYSIVTLDTMAYFVKNSAGDIYMMQVISFESGAFGGPGRVGIRTQLLDGTPDPVFVYDTLVMGTDYAAEEYYSLSKGSAGKVSRDIWDIGFKCQGFTSSITANTTMGVELYTYPHGDTNAYYPAVSINPTIDNGGISIYPVPASDLLTVNFELETQLPLNFSVYDLTGKRVLYKSNEPSGSRELRLDVSGLHPGVYLLKVSNREMQAVRKFSIR
jgi:hypothetical protein